METVLKSTTNRIVIGDVGSGKTIVAFILAMVYLESIKHGQIALLAPTEVLAFQHYTKFMEYKKMWKNNFVDTTYAVFWSGKQIFLDGKKLGKASLTKFLKSQDFLEGSTFFIGTQALLFSEFITPDMLLIDEQHRFGVNQRQKLTGNNQSDHNPHFISFSATPIPRTLALTLYKSLKPHFLKTLSTRRPIITSVMHFENFEQEIIARIQDELSKNRKVYVICAKVEDKEDNIDELWSVGKATKFLEKYFPGKVLTVHGKLTEKKDILSEFKESVDKNILVATTVVEVGVDVPKASLMIILNTERFGLSALHQIRGRVGRNDFKDNACILVTYKKYSFIKRIRYLCELQDGFAIAEKDLEIRGSGDFLGIRQSGFADDIENLLGLNPDLYYKITDLVESLDFKKLDNSLPRLQNYVQKNSQKVWGE